MDKTEKCLFCGDETAKVVNVTLTREEKEKTPNLACRQVKKVECNHCGEYYIGKLAEKRLVKLLKNDDYLKNYYAEILAGRKAESLPPPFFCDKNVHASGVTFYEDFSYTFTFPENDLTR